MFTSRAEYRLSLRQDNADIRLTKKGIDAGMVSEERQAMLKRREDGITAALTTLSAVSLPRPDWAAYGEAFQMRQKDGKYKSAADVLSMPDVTLSQIIDIVREYGVKTGDDALANFKVDILVYDTVEAISKYINYLSRQEDEMARWRKSGAMLLPTDLMYTSEFFPSFSAEELERLQKSRPTTLHAASQLQGMTPQSLIYLHTYISRGKHHVARNVHNARLASLAQSSTDNTSTSTVLEVDVEVEDPMHPDFTMTAQEAGLRRHFEEIDDVITALQDEVKN
jgi:tRNA uridine 5-carboxymethylaminomethyl modification enzyme